MKVPKISPQQAGPSGHVENQPHTGTTERAQPQASAAAADGPLAGMPRRQTQAGASAGANRSTIKAVIFDLDNTLADAKGVGNKTFAPAFDAIRQANRGTLDEAALQKSFDECWRTSFPEVAAKHGYSAEMTKAGNDAFANLSVPESAPYVGYSDMDLVKDLPVPAHLVTSGFTHYQNSKIDRLGIRDAFKSVMIDDALGKSLGKKPLFEKIQASEGLNASEVAIVGDNPHSEISVGKALGMPTVQMLRPGVARSELADHHIEDLSKLSEVLPFAKESGDESSPA